MVKNCPANYKNLSQIQSFSEQMYPTVQWAEQNCKNDEYLKQKTEELEYLTPPAVRKRFSPILLDELNSWGCKINTSLDEAKKDTVMFNADTDDEVIIDFNNFDLIDMNKSDCVFETIPTKALNPATNTQEITTSIKRACVPMVKTVDPNYSCTNHEQRESINSYWYVGFDKSKSYQVRPDWIADMFDEEIPSVVRAQTFTIPTGISDGKLESIDLWIQNNGTLNSNWGSPLVVQIWKTTPRKVEVTTWDKNKKKSVPTGEYEYISWPEGDVRKPLAQSVFYPSKTSPAVQNFLFDKAITVNSGEKYAVVVLSPLSHNEHCPRLGGWGRNCVTHKYDGGDAFLSEDNGRTFVRYGRNDLQVSYNFGQLTPQDFAFKCHINIYHDGRDTTEQYYLYLKPIVSNPIKEVQINPISVGGNENSNSNLLVFEVSSTGKQNSWMSLDENYKAKFSKDGTTGEYPHMVFVRARMKANLPSGSETTEVTPYIEKFIVNLTLDSPAEMYARTHYYYPKISPMLGANVWGRVYAPFTAEPGVEGSVEIIQEKLFTEHFTIITAEELSNYTYIDDDNQLQSTIPGLDVEKITDDDLSVRYQYLIDSPNALNLLKARSIYVKPYTYIKDEKTVTHMMSFDEGIQFTNNPAYPIQQCLIQPDGNTEVQAYGEWLDFVFDYDNDVLKFYHETNNNVIADLPIGNLSVSYNPIFIQDLTANEIGRRESDEGLILDYFKETFIISDTELENRSVTLRVNAVDPIRSVLLNGEELYEDVDYTVDYTNHQINFPVLDNNSTTILNANDNLTVIYTPNLEDTGIAIGYRAKRTNKDKQMIIKPNYIEYKV